MSTSLPPSREPARETDHPLARAFRSFTEAAGSLERTYGQLHLQVAHLRQELEVTNRDLTVSLGENSRMRERLRHILESLPCGVLVVEGRGADFGAEPGGGAPGGGQLRDGGGAAASIADGARERPRNRRGTGTGGSGWLEAAGEKTSEAGTSGVWVAIRHAWLERKGENASSVFILRDMSAAKQWEQEREHSPPAGAGRDVGAAGARDSQSAGQPGAVCGTAGRIGARRRGAALGRACAGGTAHAFFDRQQRARPA